MSDFIPFFSVLADRYWNSPQFKELARKTQYNYQAAYLQLNVPLWGIYLGGPKYNRAEARAAIKAELALMSPGQQYQVLTFLRVLFRYGLENDLVEDNPINSIPMPKLGEYRRWPEELISSFVENCQSRRVLIATVVAVNTGARLSDVAGHPWDRVYYDHNWHTRFGTSFFWKYSACKTKNTITVPINQELQKVLTDHRSEDVNRKLFPVHPKILSNEFGRERARQGIPSHTQGGYCFHGLRKSAAARLAEAGCTTREIMAVTGHRSLKEVERYTLEASQVKLAQSAIAKLEAA